MAFPSTRLRRLRRTDALRSLVRETSINIHNLVYPLFVLAGEGRKEPISSLPGLYKFSADLLLGEVEQCVELGIRSFLLFGIPDKEKKDDKGLVALSHEGVVQKALNLLKERVPEALFIADLCFCEYTSHGHCGVVVDGEVDNDKTLELLGKQAVSLASAGADLIAPSGMMDGAVSAIREALDSANFTSTAIISYSAKYASSFYGPFRDAVETSPYYGNRKGYQMDPCNAGEALREIELDIEEGADIVMVKPALAYLDIIAKAKQNFNVPVAAYNVSGEYAMVKNAASLDQDKVALEILLSIKRAGADILITYFAKDAAKWIRDGFQL